MVLIPGLAICFIMLLREFEWLQKAKDLFMPLCLIKWYANMYSIICNFFTVKPNIIIINDTLTANSSWMSNLLTLFLSSKSVVVDRKKKVISIYRKRWWHVSSEQNIPYNRIDKIDYSFRLKGESAVFFSRSNITEIFSVSVILKHPIEKVELLTFTGSAAIENRWNRKIIEESPLISSLGNQESSSRYYVRCLENFTGKTTGPL
jgi:hypothetical protein